MKVYSSFQLVPDGLRFGVVTEFLFWFFRVCAMSDMKAWAELAAVPAKYCYPLPDGISYQVLGQ